MGAIDEPTSVNVERTGLPVCRFRGWAASTRGRAMKVCARVGGGPPIAFAIAEDRPDVIEALGSAHGITDRTCGFRFDVDFPDDIGDGAPITVEFSDGEFVATSPEFRVWQTEGGGATKESLAYAHLRGEGVEFGALHLPLDVDRSRCVVRYVDRLSKEEALAKFPELRVHYDFVDPDFLIDLDRSDLSELRPHGFDFFIANDVIEHVANPVRFLRNVYGAMKPGAVLFLSVPDRDYTFDHRRDLTTTEHLWREHDRGVTTVSAAHLRDFIRYTEPGGLPRNPLRRRRLYRFHRERSIHVHVWDQASFDEFLARTCDRFALDLEIVDRAESRHTAASMVYVLRRSR
jgi:SAM-dependent methyltransferase